MWEAIKNALMSVKEATGIEIPEIPGLPADLGSIGESAATPMQTVTASATGVVDGATTAAEAVTGGIAAVGETAAAAVDSASQALPDLAGGLTDGFPKR